MSIRSPAATSPSPCGTRASACGAEHRGEHVRALRLGGPREPAVVALLQPHAHHLVALRVAPKRLGGRACAARRSGSAPWSARIAGRANRWNVTIADTGLPGSPNTSVPSRVPNQVGLPGWSRTPQNRSSTPSSASAGFTWSCGPTETPPLTQTTSAASSASASAARVASASSRHAAALDHLRARLPRLRGDAVGVRVADLAGSERGIGLDQLVAGREHREPRPLPARHGRDSERSEHGQLRRADRRPRGDDGLARVHVLAGAPDVRPGFAGRDGHFAVALLGRLDGDDRVRPLGDHRASRDPARDAGRERGRRGRARARLAVDAERARLAVGHGEPVHRRRIERRQVLLGDGRCGEHALEGGGEVDVLRPQRLHLREHALACLVDRNQLRRRAHARIMTRRSEWAQGMDRRGRAIVRWRVVRVLGLLRVADEVRLAPERVVCGGDDLRARRAVVGVGGDPRAGERALAAEHAPCGTAEAVGCDARLARVVIREDDRAGAVAGVDDDVGGGRALAQRVRPCAPVGTRGAAVLDALAEPRDRVHARR